MSNLDCLALATIAHVVAPATDERIRLSQVQFSLEFPIQYISLLRCSNGFTAHEQTSSLFLYSTEELAERNETYEVKTYLAKYILIGDDGGGRGIFISTLAEDTAVYCIGLGSMLREDAIIIGTSIQDWIEKGLTL